MPTKLRDQRFANFYKYLHYTSSSYCTDTQRSEIRHVISGIQSIGLIRKLAPKNHIIPAKKTCIPPKTQGHSHNTFRLLRLGTPANFFSEATSETIWNHQTCHSWTKFQCFVSPTCAGFNGMGSLWPLESMDRRTPWGSAQIDTLLPCAVWNKWPWFWDFWGSHAWDQMDCRHRNDKQLKWTSLRCYTSEPVAHTTIWWEGLISPTAWKSGVIICPAIGIQVKSLRQVPSCKRLHRCGKTNGFLVFWPTIAIRKTHSHIVYITTISHTIKKIYI